MFLVLVGILTYWNSLSGPFIFDDRSTILDNHQIESLTDLGRVLSPPVETPVAGRPVVNASFALNYAIGDRQVTGYHVGNLAIHILCALVIYGIVRRTLQSPACQARFGGVASDLAFAVALLWLLHPLASEAVDYLSQRTESLMALWYLLTLYAAIRALQTRRSGRWTAASILACALGMASKESMVTAPVMVALYDRTFVFDSLASALRSRWRLYAGLAAGWLVLASLLWSAPRSGSAGFSAAGTSPWVYLLNQFVMVSHYLWLAVWPHGLALYYGWPRALALRDVWPEALWIGALVALTGLALVRWPKTGFLGAWILVTLAPTSSIVPIATEVGAERRMYLPLAALVALVVLGGVELVTWLTRLSAARAAPPVRASAWWRAGLLAGACVILALMTVSRNQEYRSSLTLAQTTLERWPSPGAHSMLGTELAAAGRYDLAEMHLRTAAPDFPPARYYLASVLAAEGKTDEEIAEFQSFIRLPAALVDAEQLHTARSMLAGIFVARQQWADAVVLYREILAADPTDLIAEGQLAAALVRQQSYAEAIQHYQALLAQDPNDAGALGGLGVALAATGRLEEAIAAFRRAVAGHPGDTHAHQNLARALLAHGDVAAAGDEARQAIVLGPGDAPAHELYGRVLAREGKLEEARRELERALQLDPASPAREILRQLGGIGS